MRQVRVELMLVTTANVIVISHPCIHFSSFQMLMIARLAEGLGREDLGGCPDSDETVVVRPMV